jgi:ABC-type transport system involved in multi-copper enzyme maturation permease subunit
MNYPMIVHLVRKDWQLNQRAVWGSLVGGILSLLCLSKGTQLSFFLGVTLLVTMLIAIGSHLVISMVINEHKEQTLAFSMTLPITYRDYSAAKIAALLLSFLLPWTTLFIGAIAVIMASPIPDGLIPLVVVMLIEILVNICLMLSVALISESNGWTIGALMVGNVGFNAILFFLANQTNMGTTMQSPVAVWTPLAFGLITLEAALIVAMLSLTVVILGRKTSLI